MIRCYVHRSEAPVSASAPDVDPFLTSISPSSSEKSTEGRLFNPEQQQQYEQPYREGYDVPDVEYESWL